MAGYKLHQVRLVSADGMPQPPFPGGWVLAIFDALHAFAPEYAAKYRLPVSSRTHVRLKSGQSVKQSTYDEIEAKLVELIAFAFPKVAAINGFAAKYVAEYFRLWKGAAEVAPSWAKGLGFEPEISGVLARAFLRDLVLRLCYLESCERALCAASFAAEELALLRHDAPSQVYAGVIRERKREQGLSMEKLAEEVDLNNDKSLYRFQNGKELPSRRILWALSRRKLRHRLLAGIGFFDALTREVGLSQGAICTESLRVTEAFLVNHGRTLPAGKFEEFSAKGDNLLLHPGFEVLWGKIPDALWRTHIHALRFARVAELAQAYLQFTEPENDRALARFLDLAERESAGDAHHWMIKLRDRNNVEPFSNKRR